MASKQIQCEICCNEHAVGYCKTCGYVGETCVNIHKTGKMFQTHTVIMHEAVKKHTDSSENPNVKLRDITEERCKQHPTERAIFLCNIHDSMICGRCIQSEHIPCVKEVVDLLHEVDNINCEKVNTMKALLMEVQDEILLLKDEAELSKEIHKKNVDKCVQECMALGHKIKQRVDELTSGIRDGIKEKHNENLITHSHITKMCDEKTKWCHDEESKIDDFVDNNMTGHLYLMSRHFERAVSDARSYLKEIKNKHAFKGFDFKENNVILKCVFEDLEEVCEHQVEVTGSDDRNANDVCASTTKINKTRREHLALLSQVKQGLNQSEKKRKILEQELLKAKQDIEESEKTRRELIALLDQIKLDLDQSEKTRNALCDELKQLEQDKDNSEKKRKILEQELLNAKQNIAKSEKERAVVKAQFSQFRDNSKWTQPTGTVDVKTSTEVFPRDPIHLCFTFPDGVQTDSIHVPCPTPSITVGTLSCQASSPIMPTRMVKYCSKL
ncbi:cingulin-like protein 1 isoform X2 [Mya arenaria]|uniref:cingulin-like protein 1 isoform X2 n=1 Tax=Mya arenaria TaxID=6604 RepID=UPI0022DEA546|nr:cingulin-like protein 1 isoform X2 [Mya arenaria]